MTTPLHGWGMFPLLFEVHIAVREGEAEYHREIQIFFLTWELKNLAFMRQSGGNAAFMAIWVQPVRRRSHRATRGSVSAQVHCVTGVAPRPSNPRAFARAGNHPDAASGLLPGISAAPSPSG
jgi:hypothetical protein